MKQKLNKTESFIAGCLFFGFIGICSGIVFSSIPIAIGAGAFFVGICIIGTWSNG